jgi:transcriptional regulator GlxA family with amidase domain
MGLSVGIYLFDEVEVLDFAGPFEVFSVAARVQSRREPNAPKAFEVFTVSESRGLIRARGALMVQAAFTLATHPHIDLLIVPGGVVDAELEKPAVIEWVKRIDASSQLTTSVCTGAFILGRAGLLDGLEVTTHWEDIPDLERAQPNVKVLRDVDWVDQGRIVTSAGISAGINMSLHLVSRLHSPELAVATARQMQYVWTNQIETSKGNHS